MKRNTTIPGFLLAALLAGGTANACGEGQFNMGHGLRYQGFLAPRPATVLIYSTAGDSVASRDALVKGLRESGHTVVAVSDANAVSEALASHRFDVLITDYENVDIAAAKAQGAGSAAPALLPVVDRRMRKDPGLHERFRSFVLSGASLGQYLKSINSALPVAAR